MDLSIYPGRLISGRSQEEVLEYYDTIHKELTEMGYKVFHPMVGKGIVRNEMKFRAESPSTSPICQNHAIKERDKWMVQMADIIMQDFTGATQVSIGCISELAWADLLGKHTVVVMEPDNIHRHAFTLEMADIVFETLAEAKEYLRKLIKKEI